MSNYMFSNLCGCVYSQGNLIYTPDGDSLISPVGNRVTVFNLRSSTSVTLPFELDKDIRTIALSPDGVLLVAVDVDGRCLLCNLPQRTVLARFNFKVRPRIWHSLPRRPPPCRRLATEAQRSGPALCAGTARAIPLPIHLTPRTTHRRKCGT